MDALDTLALDLRERLLASAGERGWRSAGAHPRAGGSRGGRAERGAAGRAGGADRRARVRARAARAAARRSVGRRDHGLRVRAGLGRAGRAARGHRRALRARGGPAGRDRAHPGAAGSPRGRGGAVVRRAAAGRLARERRAAAAGAGRACVDDPAVPPPRVLAVGSRLERDADAAAARLPGPRGARAGDGPGVRRHRLRQDDDAERAVVVRGGERARGHDRGRRRAAAACSRMSSGWRRVRPTSKVAAR